MKTTRTGDIRALLSARGIRPSKAMGQHFLCDENMARWIVRRSGVGPTDAVLEIGPGLGALTELLAQSAGEVVAIEADARLYNWLTDRFADYPAVRLVHADALDVDWPAFFGSDRHWMLVSNLPYSSGTRMLMRLFELPTPPPRALVTLQMDVAERMVAGPGSPAYGLLAIWGGREYEAQIVRSIPPECFHPPPGVVSAVIELRRRTTPLCAPRDLACFRELTRQAFMRRRKQMRRILLDLPPSLLSEPFDPDAALRAAGVAPDARPETLPIQTWGALADALHGVGSR